MIELVALTHHSTGLCQQAAVIHKEPIHSLPSHKHKHVHEPASGVLSNHIPIPLLDSRSELLLSRDWVSSSLKSGISMLTHLSLAPFQPQTPAPIPSQQKILPMKIPFSRWTFGTSNQSIWVQGLDLAPDSRNWEMMMMANAMGCITLHGRPAVHPLLPNLSLIHTHTRWGDSLHWFTPKCPQWSHFICICVCVCVWE